MSSGGGTAKMIRFECPCGAKLKTEDDQAGKIFHCPKCDGRVSVPDKISRTGIDVGQVLSVDSLKGQEDANPTETPPELPTVKRPERQMVKRPTQEWLERQWEEKEAVPVQKPLRYYRPYLACRWMQFALKVIATVSMLGAVLSFGAVFAPMTRGELSGLSWLPTFLELLFAWLGCFTLAELLGGFVAFLEKHECYPN